MLNLKNKTIILSLAFFLLFSLFSGASFANTKKKTTPKKNTPNQQHDWADNRRNKNRKHSGIGGFTVAPLKVENIRVEPGQTMTGVLQLFPGGSGKNFEIEIGSVTQNQQGSYLFIPRSKDNNSIDTWLNVKPNKFTSGPGDTEPINWTLKVPDNAEPGDHLGVIYVTHKGSKKNEAAGGAILHGRVAIRVEATVAGEVNFNPVVKNIGVPKLSSNRNVPLTVKIVNEGNVRVDLNNANAALEVHDHKGDVQVRFRLDGVLFPKTTRVYKFTWKDAPTWAAAKAIVKMDFQDNTRGEIEATQRFYLAPWKLLLAIMIGVFAMILFGGWYLVEKRQAKKRQKNDENSDNVVSDETDSIL